MTNEKKLSRSQWIRDLITSKKPEEEILKMMEAGDTSIGINPIKPPFTKLVYRKMKKKLEK